MPSNCASTLDISKDFKRKICLPPQARWRVAADDALAQGAVLSMMKRKRFLFKRVSEIKLRQTTMTKQGYLIVYNEEENGWVLDMNDAVRIKTTTKGMTDDKTRTQITIKMRYGTFFMTVLGKDALLWVRAINSLSMDKKRDQETSTEKNEEMSIEETFVDEPSGQLISFPQDDDYEETTVDEITKASELSVNQSGWRRPASPLPPTTSFSDPTADFSIRQGTHSVATMRKILMRRAAASPSLRKKIPCRPQEAPNRV